MAVTPHPHPAAAQRPETPLLFQRIRRAIRGRRPERLPTVLSKDDVAALLARLESTVQLVVLLLDGTGIRVLKCLRLRVHGVDLSLGHDDVKTPRFDTHILDKSGGHGIVNPADTLHRVRPAESPAHLGEVRP
jgi:hypothetical protein